MNLNLLSILLLAPVLSFSQPGTTSDSTKPVQYDTSKTLLLLNEDSIVNFVVNYYRPEFEKYQQDGSEYFSIKKEDGNLKINYTREGFCYYSRSIPLPKVVLKGDLNRDGLQDVVVSVWATGGTHAIWNDVFLFMGTKGGYHFYNKYDSYSIGHVKSYYAKFYPAHLKNGYLIGKMSMLAHNDPGCCPSLFYKTTLKFINGKFKIVSEKKIHEWDNI